MKKILHWIFHWFGQGLKLLAFSLVAALSTTLSAFLPLIAVDLPGLLT